MVLFSALSGIYNYANKMTNGKLNENVGKFIAKNGGKVIGNVASWAGNKLNKPEWKKKGASIASNIAEKANQLFGNENSLAKNASDAARIMNGEKVAYENIHDHPLLVQNSILPYSDVPQQPFVKNLGGSNYYRHSKHGTIRRGRRRRTIF